MNLIPYSFVVFVFGNKRRHTPENLYIPMQNDSIKKKEKKINT